MNELEYIQLFIIDEISDLLSGKSNNYIKNNKYGIYPDLNIKKGINKEDILTYIGLEYIWDYINILILKII